MKTTKRPAPAITIGGIELWRSAQVAAMLHPPTTDRNVRAHCRRHGLGRVFGRTLFISAEEIQAIQGRRRG